MTFKEYIDRAWNYDGMSAKCLYGFYRDNKQACNYPHDPDDLCRVLQALRLVHVSQRLYILRDIALEYNSKQWMALYKNWNELMDIFSKEWDSNSAPKTYAFMKEIYQK